MKDSGRMVAAPASRGLSVVRAYLVKLSTPRPEAYRSLRLRSRNEPDFDRRLSLHELNAQDAQAHRRSSPAAGAATNAPLLLDWDHN